MPPDAESPSAAARRPFTGQEFLESLRDRREVWAYRVIARVAYPGIKELTERILGSALIYINSLAVDFRAPALRPYLDTCIAELQRAAASGEAAMIAQRFGPALRLGANPYP